MFKYHIQTIKLTSGSAASISFSNIPQTYDDLLVVFSARSDRTSANVDTVRARFNAATSGYSYRAIEGTGSGVSSFSSTSFNAGICATDNCTSNTFGNSSLYIPNYTSGAAKSGSAEGVSESNATTANQFVTASLWTGTSAITSIALAPETGSIFKQYSSASLYGIKRGSDGKTLPAALGGTITTSGGYTIHTFTSSGTFTPNRSLNVEYVVVGGGGGSTELGGGGGAGGYRSSVSGESSGGGASAEPSIAVSAGSNYVVTVGAGGAGRSNVYAAGDNGSSSSFATVTSLGGGGGGRYDEVGISGASGGGAGRRRSPGGSGTSGQGFAGGNGTNYTSDGSGGGGGGAGQAGQSNASAPSNGGNGVSSSITGTATHRAGGGGGGTGLGGSVATGGLGGGGNGGANSGQSGASGTANTGGGGGGGSAAGGNGGSGGSGVVIIRYLTPA